MLALDLGDLVVVKIEVLKNLLDDLGNRLVLEDAAVGGSREEPEPGHHLGPVVAPALAILVAGATGYIGRRLVGELVAKGAIAESPITDFVAAVSVGVFRGLPVLDLDYAEDSTADTDMNVVVAEGGGLIEVQGTAEGAAFERAELNSMLDLAVAGGEIIISKQREALSV